MQSIDTVELYERGSKGIRNDGVLGAQPRSLWQRAGSLCKDVIDVWREARALEARLLGNTHYRRMGYD